MIDNYCQQLDNLCKINVFKLLMCTINPHFSYMFKMHQQIKRYTLLVVILAIFFTSLSSQNPSGGLQRVVADDIWAKTLSGGQYSEMWNYQIYFDNGMSLYIVFSVTNFGRLKSAVSGIRVSMYGLDGETYHINREYPAEELHQDKTNYKFDINPRQDNIWFKGNLPEKHEIYINTAKFGFRFKIHLHFNEIQPGYRLGNGIFSVDGEPVGIITHIPFAKVTGYAGINDDVRDVRGVGYMDQTWQFQNATKLFKNGYRFIHHMDSANWDHVYFMLPANTSRNPIGYRLKSDNGEITIHGIQKFSAKSTPGHAGVKIPSTMELILYRNITVTLENTDLTDVSSVFTELNWITRRLMRTIVGGEIVDYRGKGRMISDTRNYKNGYFNYFTIE